MTSRGPLHYLALGDSYTIGTGASDESHSWPAIIAARLGAELTNPAVNGFTTLDLMDAQFVTNSLAREGIPATLQNQHSETAGVGARVCPPCVVVRAEDWPRARAWIEQYEHYRQRRRARHDRRR